MIQQSQDRQPQVTKILSISTHDCRWRNTQPVLRSRSFKSKWCCWTKPRVWRGSGHRFRWIFSGLGDVLLCQRHRKFLRRFFSEPNKWYKKSLNFCCQSLSLLLYLVFSWVYVFISVVQMAIHNRTRTSKKTPSLIPRLASNSPNWTKKFYLAFK